MVRLAAPALGTSTPSDTGRALRYRQGGTRADVCCVLLEAEKCPLLAIATAR